MSPTSPAKTATDSARASLPYGLYAWTLFTLLGALAMLPLIVLPTLAARRRLVRKVARLVLRLAGMRLVVQGLQQLPYPCIVVANHASYLDGVALMAALPPRFSFVIKREMATVPLAGTLLGRIGSQFVERHNRARSATDARRLLMRAHDGDALVFFPEGTFGPETGLMRFHAGAFAAAVRASEPLVPIVIRGTRRCLPPGHMLPHRGVIEIQILAPLLPPPGADDPTAALSALARSQMLQHLDEPDLCAATRISRPRGS